MRPIMMPFVVAPPSGARIRTRLRLDAEDEQVLRAVGEYLSRLAGQDLQVRCRLGRTHRGGDQRADRKQVLTTASSSRWAGAITRTSNDQWQRAYDNLLDARAGLRRACRRIRSRLAVPVGERHQRVWGYASRAERFAKQCRLRHLEARLAAVERRLVSGRVSVCRGGRSLAKLRHTLNDSSPGSGGRQRTAYSNRSPRTLAEWRARWQAARLFLTADGEADKPLGNETIRVHPDAQWLELRLPTPLAHLSNTPGRAITYRLSCPVAFSYRADEWTAQATSGAVRYDLFLDPARRRWYADASWRLPMTAATVPSPEDLRHHRALGVDLNAEHLDCWVLDPAGNPLGVPHTIPLALAGLEASTRDGRLRAAVAAIIRLAAANGCRSVMVENLDFTDARQTGRETLGRGKRGKRFRRIVAAIPTRKFRELLVGMAANAGLWVVAVDPAWTSVWGARYWQQPLNQSTKPSVTVSGHHAAAVVIGRRGLGHRARRREWCDRSRPEDRYRRATDSAGRPMTIAMRSASRLVVPEPAMQGTGGPGGQRAGPQAHKTRLPERSAYGDQATQDRSVPPEVAGSHPQPS
jgi:hypothetical protein